VRQRICLEYVWKGRKKKFDPMSLGNILKNENIELNRKETAFGNLDCIALTQDPVYQGADIFILAGPKRWAVMHGS
jgi:hypothetical protein